MALPALHRARFIGAHVATQCGEPVLEGGGNDNDDGGSVAPWRGTRRLSQRQERREQ